MILKTIAILTKKNLGILVNSSRFCCKMSPQCIKAALIQMNVGVEKTENLKHAEKLIKEAAGNNAKIVALPECFNSPYGTQYFDKYSESVPSGETCAMLSRAANQNDCFVIGGSIPEKEDGKVYNTCTIWNPKGDMIGKYRKMHLFDIDIPNGITFKESDILSSGSGFTMCEMYGVNVGFGICYDLRFEEIAKIYRKQGAQLLVYPGAFNMTTGPLHWEILQRGRALDNQVFVMSISPARGKKGYIAWGHSQVTDPWGKVIAQAKESEEIVYADLDFNECKKIRENIPIFMQRREDLYDTINKIKCEV